MSRRSRKDARARPSSLPLTELPRAHESVRRFPGHELLHELPGDVAKAVSRIFAAQPLRFSGSRFRVFAPGAVPRAQRRRAAPVPFLLRIRAPSNVRFCVTRKRRREVLFAMRKVGFRGSSPGKGGRYFRSQNSQYRC